MFHLDPENDPSIHMLEGSSGNEPGGLIIMKKGPGPSSDKDKHVFKTPAPRTSVLGLDRLAAEKRKQKEDEEKEKSRVTSYKDDVEEGDDVESDMTPARHKSDVQKDR